MHTHILLLDNLVNKNIYEDTIWVDVSRRGDI